MSVNELRAAAKRRSTLAYSGPEDKTRTADVVGLADFAARLLLSLDVEAVERRNVADVINISAAVIAAMGE